MADPTQIARGDLITWYEPMRVTYQRGGNIQTDQWRVGRIVSLSKDGIPTKVVDQYGAEARLFSAKNARLGMNPQFVRASASMMDVPKFLADVRENKITFESRESVAKATTPFRINSDSTPAVTKQVTTAATASNVTDDATKQLIEKGKALAPEISPADRKSYLAGYRAGQRGSFDALGRADQRGVSSAWTLGFFDGEAGEEKFTAYRDQLAARPAPVTPAAPAPAVTPTPTPTPAVEPAPTISKGADMAAKKATGGASASLQADGPEIIQASRARQRARLAGQLGGRLEVRTPGSSLVPYTPPGSPAVVPGTSLVGPVNQTVAVPSAPGGVPAVPAARSLASQQAASLAAPTEQLALNAGRPAIPLGPASTAASSAVPPSAATTARAFGNATGAFNAGGVVSNAGAGLGNVLGGGGATPTSPTAPTGPAKGRIASMLSSTPFARGGGGGAGGGAGGLSGMFGQGGALGPQSLGRGLGYAAIGTVASNIFDSVVPEQDGAWDDAASNAMQWGGIGAGVGSMFGPVGTAIGAGAGALLGGGYSLITGGSDSPETNFRREMEKQDKRFGNLLSNAMLSPEAQVQIRNQLNAMNFGLDPKTDKDLLKQNYTQVAQLLPALAQQEEQQKRQLSYMLAMQNYLAPQYDQFLQSLGADQRAFTAANNELANQVGGANGAYIRQVGAKGVLSDAATNAAYKAQLDNSFMQQAATVGAPQSIVDSLTQMYG